MQKRINLTALFCGGLVLFASAATSVAANRPQNQFAGSWAGTFVNVDTGQGGTLEWTISGNGRLVGNYLWDDGASGTFVGIVQADGTMLVAAPGGGGAFRGSAAIINGEMIVNATDIDNGDQYLIELNAQ